MYRCVFRHLEGGGDTIGGLRNKVPQKLKPLGVCFRNARYKYQITAPVSVQKIHVYNMQINCYLE